MAHRGWQPTTRVCCRPTPNSFAGTPHPDCRDGRRGHRATSDKCERRCESAPRFGHPSPRHHREAQPCLRSRRSPRCDHSAGTAARVASCRHRCSKADADRSGTAKLIGQTGWNQRVVSGGAWTADCCVGEHGSPHSGGHQSVGECTDSGRRHTGRVSPERFLGWRTSGSDPKVCRWVCTRVCSEKTRRQPGHSQAPEVIWGFCRQSPRH